MPSQIQRRRSAEKRFAKEALEEVGTGHTLPKYCHRSAWPSSHRSKWRRRPTRQGRPPSPRDPRAPGSAGNAAGRARASPRLRACARARGGGGLYPATGCSRGAGRIREDGGPGECRVGSRGSRRGLRARGHSEVQTAAGKGE